MAALQTASNTAAFQQMTFDHSGRANEVRTPSTSIVSFQSTGNLSHSSFNGPQSINVPQQQQQHSPASSMSAPQGASAQGFPQQAYVYPTSAVYPQQQQAGGSSGQPQWDANAYAAYYAQSAATAAAQVNQQQQQPQGFATAYQVQPQAAASYQQVAPSYPPPYPQQAPQQQAPQAYWTPTIMQPQAQQQSIATTQFVASPIQSGGQQGYSPALNNSSSNSGSEGPKQLIVNYLAPHVTSAQLHQLFAPFGPLDGARVIYDRHSGCPKGYGFVYYKHALSAVAAIEKMNGYALHGKWLKVGYSTNPLTLAGTGAGPVLQ